MAREIIQWLRALVVEIRVSEFSPHRSEQAWPAVLVVPSLLGRDNDPGSLLDNQPSLTDELHVQ